MKRKVIAQVGGGIRGAYTATLGMEIERRLGCNVMSKVDLVAGTSTGGILALLLTKPGATPYSYEAGLDLYRLYGPQIFHRPWVSEIVDHWALVQKQYPGSGIESVLKKYFGNVAISQATTNVIVTAYDFEQNTPHLFKSVDGKADPSKDVAMWYAARCTSAAPKYFPAMDQYWDGGLFAADPSMCALTEAKAMWPDDDIFLVSLGTGHRTNHYDRRDLADAGVVGVLIPAFECLQEGSYADVKYQLDVWCKNKVRLGYDEIPLSVKPGMDDASPENINALVAFAEQTIKDHSSVIDQICEGLSS